MAHRPDLSSEADPPAFDLDTFRDHLEEQRTILIDRPEPGQTGPSAPQAPEHLEAILDAMTIRQRRNPRSIDAFERAQIARLAGVPLEAVESLLKRFEALSRAVAALNRWKARSRLERECGESREAPPRRPWVADWDDLDRTGRVPPHRTRPWFTHWSRDIRLWDWPATED